MEWLVSLLVVPAIVAAIVLLFGFTGCSFDRLGIEPPTILSATPLVPDLSAIPPLPLRVAVKFMHESLSAATFQAERTKGGEASSDTFPVEVSGGPVNFQFVDESVEPATEYSYRLIAVRTDTGAKSFSEPATVETFGRVFTAGLALNALVPGACIVQRLALGTFTRPSNLISITVRAASNGALALSKVTISSPAPSGDAFDSAGTPIEFTPLPAMPVPAGQAAALPSVEFNVNADAAPLIAFDVGDPGNAALTGGVPHTAFIKQPAAGGQITEAGTADRSGFTEQPNILWLIDAVDVATKWPPIP